MNFFFMLSLLNRILISYAKTIQIQWTYIKIFYVINRWREVSREIVIVMYNHFEFRRIFTIKY